MNTTGKIFQISKFPDTLSFVVTPGMFWRNLDDNRTNLYTQ